MLKFNLNTFDESPWKFVNNKWCRNTSFIEAFVSPYIECFFITSSHKQAFIIREINASSSNKFPDLLPTSPDITLQQFNRIIGLMEDWEQEYCIIEIDKKTGSIKLKKGKSNKIGIYFILNNGNLIGSWNIADLYKYINKNEIFQDDNLLMLLAGKKLYNNKTIFKNIYLMSERGEVNIEGWQINFKSPSESPVFNERALKDNVNYIDAFYDILKKNINLSTNGFAHLASELSGGLDSALVSIAAADVFHKELNTFGMQLANNVGEQQKIRRNEIIGSFGFKDTFVSVENYGPLMNDGYSIRSGSANIYDEIYHDALTLMTETLSNRGGAILTGIGGDELAKSFKTPQEIQRQNFYANYQFINQRDQIAEIAAEKFLPFPAIYVSMIFASQSRSPVFLKQGIWPIEPFCQTNIIRFCQYLPEEIKRDKKIHRLVLEKKGLSNNFLFPNIRENFSGVYENHIKNINRKNILSLMNKSKLHDLGYINKELFIKNYFDYISFNKKELNPIIYYIIPALEYTLINLFGC